GKQDLWIRQKPEVIQLLKVQAIIQSAESSNRIEGVTIPAKRLHPVVIGRVRPRDRSEEELAGYRMALDWIFSRKRQLVIRPATVLKLHSLCQGGFSGDAGKWKLRDNEIIEILPSGERVIRFKPATAEQSPKFIDRLCRNYNECCEIDGLPSLIVIADFVFEFLCIHPFRDGNGRVSRLLTTLLLLNHYFDVSRYISLERIVEERKVEYYDVLKRCSKGWVQGTNVTLPWYNFFFSLLRTAYQEFEDRVVSIDTRQSKATLVRHVVLNQLEQFTLSDIAAQVPSVSRQLIKRVLSKLKSEDRVSLRKKGRGAVWEVTN
ncbi:Fic family protein, partial [bacterium]|nr:Fic family protein [bacterium]